MWPLVLLLTGTVAGTAYFGSKVLAKAQKQLDERIRKCGGINKVNAVELVSENYKGKKKVKGRGIPLRVKGYDWYEDEFYLKLKAAENNCNIVLDFSKEGNKKDGIWFSGIGYQKS